MIDHFTNRQQITRIVLLGIILLAGSCRWAESRSPGAEQLDAKALIEAAGIKGGLIVVIGCDRPEFLADMRGAGPYLVHGLDSEAETVAVARRHLLKKGVYGPVTVSRLKDEQLPYADGLVNGVVQVSGVRVQVSDKEIERVLAPRGVAAVPKDLRFQASGFSPQPYGGWTLFTKPVPPEVDDWPQFLYDASNNAVSKDSDVGPPQGLRWTCGPRYARSHEHFASMSAMVTANGRIFYIIDEGPISSVYLPPTWNLVARDAFSGVLLWKRPITNWEAHLRGFRSGPPELARRMVAGNDRLYVTLGYGEPVTVLDAATGKQLAVLDGTSGARELILKSGVLYVLADDMSTDQHNERRERLNRGMLDSSGKKRIWSRFPRGAFPIYGKQRIAAVNTGSGKVLWKQEFNDPGEVAPATVAVADGKVCLQTLSHVVCLDAVEGKELWRRERPIATSRFSWSAPTLVMHDKVVLTVDRRKSDNVRESLPKRGSEWLMSSSGSEDRQEGEVFAFSLDDGKELWSAPCSENYNTPLDIFVIKGVVWIGDLRSGEDPGFTRGRDLRSGKVVANLPPQKAYGHHRCYRNKATVNWLMVGRGGIQFINHRDGTYRNTPVARGTCQYGVMPANGLIYTPHHSCACSSESLMVGLNAFSSRPSEGKGEAPLEKGPAYGAGGGTRDTHAWPTYRADVRRSGFQDLPAPAELSVAWTKKLEAPITAPVSSGGLVVVAETDRHTVHAASALDGKTAWTFTADGRIDSPPTLFKGLCLFGTRSGFVYCLRASDGSLAWRFRAAPRDCRIFSYEQLESAWPVCGSVLVDEDLSGGAATVYFAAGRSTFLDGGVRMYALDVKSGLLLREVNLSKYRDKALPDILSVQDGTIWIRWLGVDKDLAVVKDSPHLFAPRGFLDDSWWHRTYWLYGTEMGNGYTQWPDSGNRSPAGRLLVFDGGGLIYGYGRMAYRAGDGHVGADMTKGYKLFAEELNALQAAEDNNRKRRIKWTAKLPFVARAILLTRDALLVAGCGSPVETAGDHGAGTLWVASREDGSKSAEYTLPAPPVLDGMAITKSGIFISTVNASLVCLQSENDL